MARSPSPTLGCKRRLETEPQTPNVRRKVGPNTSTQDTKHQEDEQADKKSGTLLLSSPTDVSDLAVIKAPGQAQVRAKQAKASGLPKLSLSPIETKVDRIGEEEVSKLETEVEAEALTPRPTVRRRRTAPRPPLGRRTTGVNRAKFGVGIVRCRSWRVNEEETETEDESPAPSPRGDSPVQGSFSFSGPSVMEVAGCVCSGEDEGDEKLEDQVGSSVLPIDPSLTCFNRSYSEDQWQLRSPSPDEEFVPEKSCCGEKRGLHDDGPEGEQSNCGVDTRQ